MLDREIVKLCIAGDRKAQEKLYNFYASKMKGVCLRYSRSIVESEDIFQDGFVKVFSNLKNYSGQGSFDGWVRRIMVNTAIDTYKKNLPFKNSSQFDEFIEDELKTVELPDELEEEDLLNILSNLPDGYRLVFNLYAIEGYSHKEIAERLNISENTSKSQLHRARKLIQQILFKYNGTR